MSNIQTSKESQKIFCEVFKIKKSKIHGLGLFTVAKIEKDKSLFPVFTHTNSQSSFEQRLFLQFIASIANKDIDQIVPWNEIVAFFDIDIDPLASMINHQVKSNCELLRLDNVWYCKSSRGIRAGEEITMNYLLFPEFVKRDIAGYREVK